MAKANNASRDRRKNMDAKNSGYVLHNAIFNHPFGSLGGFFCRLEEKASGARESNVVVLNKFGKEHSSTQANCGVGIVTAGMHNAGAIRGARNVCFF